MTIRRSGFVASATVAVLGLLAWKLAAPSNQRLEAVIYGSSLGIKGADGKAHDLTIPSNFIAKADVPVRMSVTNYDETPHTITAPDLHLNAQIKPGNEAGEKTSFTFTPAKKGVFRWYCALPCGDAGSSWEMQPGYGGPGKEGFMAGYFVVR